MAQEGRSCRGEGESGRVQSLRRTSGWLLTFAGLAYAAIWACAPLGAASDWSVGVVGAASLTVFGYALRVHLTCRRAGTKAAS